MSEDTEVWTFDPVNSEFRYQLQYMNGTLEASGTYVPSPYNEGTFRLKLKDVWGSPTMWRDEWMSKMQEFDISIEFESPSEIQIDAKVPPFQTSCWSTVSLLGKFTRK